MDGRVDIECPNLFTLLHGRETNYSNLYQAFSDTVKHTLNRPIYVVYL